MRKPLIVIDGKLPGDDVEQNNRAEYYMRKIAAELRRFLAIFREMRRGFSVLQRRRGGGRGIRTPGTVSRTAVFKNTGGF